jgi:predicted nucleic acid-binding protein
LSNAVWQAERRQRITPLQGDAILQALLGLEIELLPQSWQELLPLARRFGCSAYDAAYLALSQATGEPLVTGDQRLYHLVRPNFTGVQWIGEG